MNLKEPLKVTVSLSKYLHPMWATPTGLVFNNLFRDRYYEQEEFFRERIILPINEIAGNQWWVHFTEYPYKWPKYFVDITAEDRYVSQIMNIIASTFPDINFEFWRPGFSYTHLGTRQASIQYE